MGRGFIFSQWLYVEAKQTIIDYRCKVLRIGRRDYSRLYKERYWLMGDSAAWQRQPDEPYQEDALCFLRQVISTLPQEDKNLLEVVMDCDNLGNLSVSQGFRKWHYSSRFSQVKDRIRERAAVMSSDFTVVQPRPRYTHKSGAEHHMAKAVLQLDEAGIFIKRWACSTEAEATGLFSASQIKKVARGTLALHGGFRWVYESDCPTDQATHSIGGNADKKTA